MEVMEMRNTARFLWFLIFLLTFPIVSVHAASLDCEGGIVSTGDSRVDLLMKCGEPDSKESHDEELTERLDQSSRQKTFITVEEWTYNFGPSQFMRIVTLRNGKISNLRTGNYGYSKSDSSAQRECTEQVVAVGDSKSDVLSKCGKPTFKDKRQEELKGRTISGQEHTEFVTIEEWTYNLGPNRFLRILTFRNGKLTDMKTGGYGK
jgi:hypothetical protein